MTYPKDIRQFESHRALFENLVELEPGNTIELNFSSEHQTVSTRHLIYGWLKVNRLKQFYRVYWPSSTQLKVYKLETDFEMSKTKDKLPQKLQTILTEMLQNEEKSLEIPLRYKNEGVLSPEEVGKLICEYQEFMK